jgi:hypothetical protein
MYFYMQVVYRERIVHGQQESITPGATVGYRAPDGGWRSAHEPRASPHEPRASPPSRGSSPPPGYNEPRVNLYDGHKGSQPEFITAPDTGNG